MVKVYLKDGSTVEVSLENLEDYLYENADKIESHFRQTLRPPLTPKQVQAGTNTVMTHKERQEFLKNSEIGKKLGLDKS